MNMNVDEKKSDAVFAGSFRMTLLVRHPDIEPSEISGQLDLRPHTAFKAGSPRVLPNGKALPGLATESRWSHIFALDTSLRLEAALEGIVEHLERHSKFVNELNLRGANIELYVKVSGDVNMGDSLSWKLLGRMAKLHVALGMEVFPVSRQAPNALRV